MSTPDRSSGRPAAASPQVRDQPSRTRFEATLDGELVGFAEYRRSGSSVVFTHTVVEPAWEGRGIGSALARYGLDDARRRRLRVVPECPFIRSWIERHLSYADLVSD